MDNCDLFEKEFKRIKGETYLDHAGATLYSESQINNASKDLINNLYLNPHTSKLTSDIVDQIRSQILRHFNTDHKQYTVIFTSGSTAALKLVAESFEFISGKCEDGINCAFVYLQENHTSVLGMREIAGMKGAEIIPVSNSNFVNTLNKDKQIDCDINGNTNFCERALCVYPAQCNFSGFKYPLTWIEKIKSGYLNSVIEDKIGKPLKSWSLMLDAAGFVSTNFLDLSKYKPDFVCVSFYKIFGFPTGIGCLIVKNDSGHLLDGKKYYGGGTVDIAMSGVNYHVKKKCLHERFEDGTISFLSILALKHGFDTLTNLIPKDINTGSFMDTISQHTFRLAAMFYRELKSQRHYNDKPVACIYSDTNYDDITKQGGIVNFNLLRANGEFIGYSEVTYMSQLFNIHLRSGCFCNPGACQRFLQLSDEDLKKHYKAGHICGDDNDLIQGIPTGSLRVSFGYMSNEKDVRSVIEMIEKCFIEKGAQNIPYVTNITDKISTTENDSNKILGIVSEIHIFPVKSCRSFKITSDWKLCSKGFKYDREWMIVTDSGVALSQKQDTRMCLVAPVVDLDNGELVLSFPGVNSISIPLVIENGAKSEASMCLSKVCGDRITGCDCGDEVANWLVDVFGIPGLRLIRQNDDDARISKSKNGDSNGGMHQISLSNQAQYLVINLTSVKWLANRVESQEFCDRIDNLCGRFRGNIIVETKNPFEEFSWKNICIGDIKFEVEGPCRRCQMVCIDQETGYKTTEPLRTISKHFQGKLYFGVYLSHKELKMDFKNALKYEDLIYNDNV